MTLILDNLPPTVTDALTRRAQAEGRSVSEVALEALARGLSDVRRDLSDVSGTWVEDPAFDAALAEFDKIESDLWK